MSYRRIFFFIFFFLLMFFVAAYLASAKENASTVPTSVATEKVIKIQTTRTASPATPTPVVIMPTVQSSTYTVLQGDTLQNIAFKFGVDIDLLAISNKIEDPNLIFPGQVLNITNPQRDLTVSTPVANFNNSSDNKRILVVLSEQKLYAYDGDTLLASFLISSGTTDHPTVTGEYNVWIKLDSTRMKGDGYDIPNVLWTMYFYKDYGIHAANWHNNFGVPMSHGCINMKTEDADWLYHWAEVGTPVEVIS